MRFNIQFRVSVEVEADTREAAIERARLLVEAAPSLLRPVRILEAPLHHGERAPDPAPLPLVHRAHYREGGRPIMRDRRGA